MPTGQFDSEPDAEHGAYDQHRIEQQVRTETIAQTDHLQDSRQERINREIRNNKTHKETTIEQCPANQIGLKQSCVSLFCTDNMSGVFSVEYDVRAEVLED